MPKKQLSPAQARKFVKEFKKSNAPLKEFKQEKKTRTYKKIEKPADKKVSNKGNSSKPLVKKMSSTGKTLDDYLSEGKRPPSMNKRIPGDSDIVMPGRKYPKPFKKQVEAQRKKTTKKK
jgi:hypothetical protein